MAINGLKGVRVTLTVILLLQPVVLLGKVFSIPSPYLVVVARL